MDADFILIRKMKKGEDEAFDIFVRRYYRQILTFCRFHCVGLEDAEDAAQETFTRFFSGLAQYRHSGKSLNYLYKIASNLCKDIYKKKKAEPMEQDNLLSKIDERGFDGQAHAAGYEASPDDIDTKMDIADALARLAPELREIIILCCLQDMKQREAADLLDIGIPLLKYRLRRAKEELSGLLKQDEGSN